MNEILEFLKDCGTYYIATVEDGQPRVRPIGFAMIYDGKLCFCTNNKKNMYRQMKANPNIEISGTAKNMNWLRLRGKAEFITTKESKQAALDSMPVLKNMYSADDDIFEIFAIVDAEATICSMRGENRTCRF